MKANLRLKSAILEVVENQIRDNNPPETRETLIRLMEMGDSREEAVRKIALVVVGEIYEVMKNKEVFNRERFVSKLKKLK